LALPFCSRKHHRTLKRRLTPADKKDDPHICSVALRGLFIGREDVEHAPSSVVLCAAQHASGTGCCALRLPTRKMEHPRRTRVNSHLRTRRRDAPKRIKAHPAAI
jgi:hypothetical protein